jgi:hypothetical protein
MKNTLKIKKYNLNEYNSGDGMLTTVWGPPMWHYLHTMSFNYPVNPTTKEKHDYMNFIKSLVNVLPCKYCRINLKKNFIKLPINLKVMENRHTFSKYVYDLHELINNMLNKKSGLTYEEVRDRYEHFRARCLIDVDTNKYIIKPSEKGCTEPLIGKKSKCVLNIVPVNSVTPSFNINKQCINYKIKSKSFKRR